MDTAASERTSKSGGVSDFAKDVAKVGLGCVVGMAIGYAVSRMTRKTTSKESISNDRSVMRYVTREGNVYIKQLSDIRLTTESKFPDKAMYLTPVSQCYFMKWLVSTIHARKAIEIGVFTGSSSLCIALGIKSVMDYDEVQKVSNPENANTYKRDDYCLVSINHPIVDISDISDAGGSSPASDNILDDVTTDNLAEASPLIDDNMINAMEQNRLYLQIAQKAWKNADVTDLIRLQGGQENIMGGMGGAYGMGGDNDAISILSTLYSDKSNHHSFDLAVVNYGDLASYKEYYTLLIKLIKNDGVILIAHTLGETLGETVDRAKHSSQQHNDVMDRLKSFNHKIVSDSSEKSMIEACMIVLEDQTSLTMIKKLRRNVGADSSSNLLNANMSASLLGRKGNNGSMFAPL